MRRQLIGLVVGLVAGFSVTAAASAQTQRPSLAVMPTQYFTADAQSADAVTDELVRLFESRGYTVILMDRSRAVASDRERQSESIALAPREGRDAAVESRNSGAFNDEPIDHP